MKTYVFLRDNRDLFWIRQRKHIEIFFNSLGKKGGNF